MVRPWISLYPKLAGLYGPGDVSGNVLLVGSGDGILLRFAGPTAKLIRLSVVFDTKAVFSDIVFHDAQVGIGKREIRVQFNGMFEKRNRLVRPFVLIV